MNKIQENLKEIYELQQRNTELNKIINQSKEEVKDIHSKVRALHKQNLIEAGLK